MRYTNNVVVKCGRKVVKVGDNVVDPRDGNVWTFRGVTRLPQTGMSAKVMMTSYDLGSIAEVYAEAFNLTVTVKAR